MLIIVDNYVADSFIRVKIIVDPETILGVLGARQECYMYTPTLEQFRIANPQTSMLLEEGRKSKLEEVHMDS